MKKIKILHIFGIAPVGGVGTYVKNVWSNIDKSKYEFNIVYCDEEKNSNNFLNYMINNGVEIYCAPQLILKNLKKIDKWFKVFFKENKYDIIEIHSPNIAVFFYKYIKNTKVIIHFHNTKLSHNNKLKAIRNFVLEIPIKYYGDCFIACGELVAKKASLLKNIPLSKIKVIQNGLVIEKKPLDIKISQDIIKDFKIQNKKICLCVGNCTKQKNYKFVIEIAKEIGKINKNIQFVIAGEGDLKNDLIEYCKRKKITNVTFLGFVSNIYNLYQISNLFLLPSLYEGLPLVALEAQVYGLPMIVSDSITKEIRVNQNVYFKSLKEKPTNWVKEIQDHINESKEDLDKMINSKFNIKNTIFDLDQIYTDLVKK